VIVVSPSDTGIRQVWAKTDRLDARTLARLLWAGELDGVWTPDERIRAMRRRLSRRAQLVRARSRASKVGAGATPGAHLKGRQAAKQRGRPRSPRPDLRLPPLVVSRLDSGSPSSPRSPADAGLLSF
jgi:transposase